MVFSSSRPDVPLADAPIHELVLAATRERGDAPALIDGVSGQIMTHAQFADAVDRLAAGFAESGLTKGDVLALHSPNTVLFPVVLFAASTIGVVVTTLNALSTAHEIADQLRDSHARWLVTVSALLPVAVAAGDLVGIGEVLVCDTAAGHRSIQDLLASTGAVPEVAFDLDEDLFVLPYSSGTTGRPKGVMLTHRNVGTNSNQVIALWPSADAQDRGIAVLPFFHIFGMSLLVHYLRVGGSLVVLPKFDLDQFLGAIAEHRVTRVFAVPPIVLALAKHPAVDGHDLGGMRHVFCAAAPLDPELARVCERRLGVPVRQGYGMTELSPVSHLVPDDATDPPAGTSGQLVPNTVARLVDPVTGQELGVDEVGEVWVKGPQMMRGYFGRPEDTDATVDADGWLHTGDLATVDADGYWFIVDRVKELIKYKGYQVAPADLEAVLLGHAQIADAAVIGVYNADGDECPKAFVVRVQGSPLDADTVLEFVAGQVAPYKKVRSVEFVDTIPRAASGKILRRELRDREAK